MASFGTSWDLQLHPLKDGGRGQTVQFHDFRIPAPVPQIPFRKFPERIASFYFIEKRFRGGNGWGGRIWNLFWCRFLFFKCDIGRRDITNLIVRKLHLISPIAGLFQNGNRSTTGERCDDFSLQVIVFINWHVDLICFDPSI